MMTLTANIGLGILHSALRLQENYVEYVEKKRIEKLATGCYGCMACMTNSNACENCSHKVYETVLEKHYINEKNKYGKRYALKKYALLLFIYAHFQSPDKMGHLYIDVDDAAECLHCDKKTVHNNLKLLNAQGYIVLGKTDQPGLFQLFIKDYRKYFKTASEGGRGYTAMAKDVFENLITLDNINEIRLVLRSYLYSIENVMKEAKGKSLKRTFKDIKRCLPKYCAKKQVCEMLKKPIFEKMFNIQFGQKLVEIKLKEKFTPEHVTDQLMKKCFYAVKTHVEKINSNDSDPFMMKLSVKDIKDISYIGLRYPVEEILLALDQIRKEFSLQEVTIIDDIGPLVRNIVNAKMKVQAC